MTWRWTKSKDLVFHCTTRYWASLVFQACTVHVASRVNAINQLRVDHCNPHKCLT